MRHAILAITLLFCLGGSFAFGEELFDVGGSNDVFNEGLALYFKGDYPGAIARFEESIQINPDNAKAYYFIGYSHYKAGEFEKAGDAFKAAYEQNKVYSPISP